MPGSVWKERKGKALMLLGGTDLEPDAEVLDMGNGDELGGRHSALSSVVTAAETGCVTAEVDVSAWAQTEVEELGCCARDDYWLSVKQIAGGSALLLFSRYIRAPRRRRQYLVQFFRGHRSYRRGS